MKKSKYRPILELFFITVLFYLLHKLVFYYNENNFDLVNFHYSIETIYGFFSLCSLLIILILIFVNSKSIDNVGYTFLFLTMFKIACSYILLAPILHSGNQNCRIEKTNFFIIFAVFLATETIVTIRILNNNQ